MNDNEKRDYNKGYAAGRKKAKEDRSAQNARRQELARFDRFMAAAMTGLLASDRPWSRAGKRDVSSADYSLTASNIARSMLGRVP